MSTTPRSTRTARIYLYLMGFLSALSACGDSSTESSEQPLTIDDAVNAISATNLKETVDYLADDALNGRIPGSDGHRQAREMIRDRLVEYGLEPLGDDGTYLQEFGTTPIASRFERLADGSVIAHDNDIGLNIVARLPGSDPVLSNEHIVFMSHYDHLGVTQAGEVFNGAFDDASGVAATLEIARVLTEADVAPSRSIVFLISDEEEHGLSGANAWLSNPTVPRESIVVGLSADPLGRGVLPDYAPIAILGPEHSPELFELMQSTQSFSEADVVFIPRDVIPVFGSDQDVFMTADPPLPGVWITNPGMSFYHTTDDTADTIDYGVLLNATRYMARTLHLLGEDSARYEVVGAPPIDADTARDIRPMLDGVLASTELTEAERQKAEELLDTLDRAIEADGFETVTPPGLYFLDAATFLLFELSAAHPGPIPPPFPDES